MAQPSRVSGGRMQRTPPAHAGGSPKCGRAAPKRECLLGSLLGDEMNPFAVNKVDGYTQYLGEP